jgi:hypothetical protein
MDSGLDCYCLDSLLRLTRAGPQQQQQHVEVEMSVVMDMRKESLPLRQFACCGDS